MKREESSQLLHDKVLVGTNGGHLSSDGVHILTQGNMVLRRLIPICVKLCGEHMNLVYEGLSLTGGDLRVAVLRVTYTGCGCKRSSYVSSSKSLGLPNFALGGGMGRRCCTCSSESNIGTSGSRHNYVMSDGCIRAPVHLPWVESINPYSMTDPMSNWNPLVMA